MEFQTYNYIIRKKEKELAKTLIKTTDYRLFELGYKFKIFGKEITKATTSDYNKFTNLVKKFLGTK